MGNQIEVREIKYFELGNKLEPARTVLCNIQTKSVIGEFRIDLGNNKK